MLYDESDQTLHFEGTSRDDAFSVLARHQDHVLMPQRYEKRHGANAVLIRRENFSRAMNKCPPDSPRLTAGRAEGATWAKVGR